jgi:predicted nucleotidyltransferase
MQEENAKRLIKLFENDEKVLVVYLFGSYVKGVQTSRSDIDIAILLSEAPKNLNIIYTLLMCLLERLGITWI